ncbi:MAG: type 1 glutamine amidotransferase [Rhodobacteraceae bacterium]|nr:type 1 glutamine amidotransferase [Paracoccaceae bacterium]
MLIGILQTGHLPDEMCGQSADYPKRFETLLAGHALTFKTWDVVNMDFPPGAHAADGWLITGSLHGAYEDLPFIAPLEVLIREVIAAERPLVGICFGHQIIAQALGGKVEKFGDGWAVGPQGYDFGTETLSMNAWHQDQVTKPPPGAQVIASNDFCQNAALLYGSDAFTIQPHPEFDHGFITGLITHRGRGTVPDALLDNAVENMAKAPPDNARMAQIIADFFRGKIPRTAPHLASTAPDKEGP